MTTPTLTCLICSQGIQALPEDLLVQVAQQVIQGFDMGAGTLKGLKPKREGVCIVERCARHVEAACGSCRSAECQRCAIAAGLRMAEDRINAERDAELAAIGMGEEQCDQLIDQLVTNLCAEHASFGSVLVKEWYGRRLSMSSRTHDAVQ